MDNTCLEECYFDLNPDIGPIFTKAETSLDKANNKNGVVDNALKPLKEDNRVILIRPDQKNSNLLCTVGTKSGLDIWAINSA